MARYVALVDGRSGSYGLTVPDLPGCTSAAAAIDEVLRRATEAVRLWAEDELAARGLTRSAFLASAARQKIEGQW
jgi:predicted RNase H-like HicB family nuclease